MGELQNFDAPTLKERLFGKPSVFKPGYTIPGLNGLKMDGECVRTRSTLLHMFSWSAMIHIFFIDDVAQKDMWFLMLYVLLGSEFLLSAAFGVAPLAPVGTLATILCHFFGPKPQWVPSTPKRFAWTLGFCMVNMCYWSYYFEVYLLTKLTILSCMFLTFMETACSFCVGCWMWGTLIAPYCLKEEACETCTPHSCKPKSNSTSVAPGSVATAAP